MSGYYREISTGVLFDTGTIIKTGILITWSFASITGQVIWLTESTYYRHVRAFDQSLNYSDRSNSGSFILWGPREEACVGLPSNSSPNTAISIRQTYNGTDWLPSLTYTWDTTPSGTECYFICNTNYTWNWSSCAPNFTCGNGTPEPGEACDLWAGQNNGTCSPPYNSGCNRCASDCQSSGTILGWYCGDYTITNPPETCDDGGTSSPNYDGCSQICQQEATGTIACSNGNFDFGSTGTSNSPQNLSDLADAAFECLDLSWTTNGFYQVQMWTELTNGITTIDSGSVSIDPWIVTEDVGGIQTGGGALSGYIDLMFKLSIPTLGHFGVTPTLTVNIPARASIGTYNGTLVVTYPR
jgi:cysteine-rich repeat protein